MSFPLRGLFCSPPRYHCAFPVRSRRGETLPSPGRGYSGHGIPNRVSSWEHKDLPSSWGTLCAHALLYDRGGLDDLALLRSLKFCLPLRKRRRLPRLPFRGSITRPAHSLFTLCGESYPSSRTKLGSGCWPALPDRIVYLLGSTTKFQSLDFLLVQILLGALTLGTKRYRLFSNGQVS